MDTNDFLVHHSVVTAEGAVPSRFMLVLHGILGSGGNFRSVARKLAERCPTWGFVLVDLRAHGLSQSPPPPHTLESAARDLVRLGERTGLSIAGVTGHSFGGKVALAYTALRPGELSQVWVLDSSPGAHPARIEETRPGSSSEVLRMLEELDGPLPSRERFIELVMERGHSRATADWLAMNVRRAADGFRFRLNLETIRAMLADYHSQDLWPVLEAPSAASEIHVVLGGRSESVPPSDKERYFAVARRSPWVHVHVLERAGHWVHADDPQGLVNLMSASLG